MEDLQDAIEDAQLINALNDDTPRPTKAWDIPTVEEVEGYVKSIRQKNPTALELEGICSNCLGFYLFGRYLKDTGNAVIGDFIKDAAYYRVSPNVRRVELLQSIYKHYLQPTSMGKSSKPTDLPPSLFRAPVVLVGSQIDWERFVDPNTTENLVHVTGAPLNELVQFINEHQTVGGGGILTEAPVHLLDKLDYIVFTYVNSRHFEGFKSSEFYRKYFNFMTILSRPVTEDDFTLFRVLGRGGFGVVNGCKKCQSGQLYAMKVLDRRRIKLKKSETLCMNERNILTMIDSKFVVCLKYAFTTQNELFLILDLMVGGDLGFHLHRKGRFNKREAKYYIARTLLGIKALHDLNVVYRDLKPDNILMDAKGRTKISDLGLAVRMPKNGLTGACGTRGYWAPEMLRRDEAGNRIRYHLVVDWFSLGCVLHEFLSGVCPFRTEQARTWGGLDKKDRDKAIDLAVQEMDPYFDLDIFDDPVTVDFISKLLTKDPRVRLGAKGPLEIMEHPYFSDINWESVTYERMPPPAIPRKDLNVASQTEIGSFADDANSKKLEITSADMEIFSKWDYVKTSAQQEEVVIFLQYEELQGPIDIVPTHTGCCCMS